MTNYWDHRFLQKFEKNYEQNFKIVFEVGARYGDETIKLVNIFKNATLFSFECNPLTVNICKEKFTNLGNPRIKFFDFGLGQKNEKLPFYSYIVDSNDGASSFSKRIDFDSTQKKTGDISIKTLNQIFEEEKIPLIDLLCMDIQGFELNVLKGAGDNIKNVRYIIMEEPSPKENNPFLPRGVHSKYIDCPKPNEIKEFMKSNNFQEIERIPENHIEDNVMYKNLRF
jgi:FkbM family methyltransferase